MRTSAALVLTLLLPLSGQARQYEPSAGSSYEAYARVLSVTPIVEQVEQRVPTRRCRWVDPHGVRHQCRARPVKRCSVIERNQVVDRIAAYRVKLSYNGEVFYRTTRHHPGDKFRVQIAISPTTPAIAPEKSESERQPAIAVQPAFR